MTNNPKMWDEQKPTASLDELLNAMLEMYGVESKDRLYSSRKKIRARFVEAYSLAINKTYIKRSEVQALIDKVIGKDEYVGRFSALKPIDERYKGRDDLRAEQRKRASNALGEGL